MAELVISKRVIFPRGRQREFLERVLSKVSVKEAAQLCGLSERTIRDWRCEKLTMDSRALRVLSQESKISYPSDVTLRDRYWYVTKGARVGGYAVLKKYGRIGGDPEYRKKRWYEWWEREGKYKDNSITVCKPIRKPEYSKELAEFVGIVLGDGGITQRQVTISLHDKDDREYAKFVVRLVEKLFDVPVGTYHKKKDSVVNFIISRRELVRFCIEKLGLKEGNKIKQQVDIPQWIKQDKMYSIACVRGLLDTDGCVFNHRYKVKGKLYSYKKLSFTSYSQPLRNSVFCILKGLALNPRLAQDRDVRLDAQKDMRQYFQIVGSNNPKHLKRYKN